jgi:hypothetical protein
MKELRKLDFKTDKTFDCGGKKFTVNDSLSFARYRESQKIMLEFGFSASFVDIYNNLKSCTEAFDKGKYFDMATIIYKVMEGVKNTIDKDEPSFRLCALFINEEEEDPTIYNELIMKKKIECWSKELDVSPFFYLAASLVEGWMNAYESTIRNGLIQKELKEKEKSGA